MESPRPTLAEIRLVFFPTGVLSVIALAAWADASPTSHLWDKTWFLAAAMVFGLMAVVGLFGFIAHWGLRAIPVVALALTAAVLLLHTPAWVPVAVFSVAFLATAYFVSPDRNVPDTVTSLQNADEVNDLKEKIDGLREGIYQANGARDEMRAERDACKKELQEMTGQRDYVEAQWKAHLRDVDATTVPKNIAASLAEERNALRQQVQALEAASQTPQSEPGPMLSGCVKRFEILDAGDLSDLEMKSFDRDMGRAPTVSEGLRTIFNRPPGAWYIVWFQVEALSAQSKATDWAFEVRGIGGEGYPCAFVSRDWKPPKSWPALDYSSLEQIENMYLESARVYNVFVHVVCEAAYSQIRFETFEARCRDSAGQEIILRMAR
jgi:hypothetical protein